MCISRKTPSVRAPAIAAYDNREANQTADVEARLRKRRAGAAANIFTSAVGLPAGSGAEKMGQTA